MENRAGFLYRLSPNPFALQAFSIADIDTSIYVPLILLAVWAPLRFVFANAKLRTTPIGWRDYGLVILIFFLCFWAKLTTTLSLPLIFGTTLSVRFGLWRSIGASLGITIASAALFILSYWIYGRATGLDISYTWRFLIQSVVSKSGAGGPPVSAFATLADHLLNTAISFVRWGLAFGGGVLAEIELIFNVAKASAPSGRAGSRR